MFDDDNRHSDDCDCFACAVSQEAQHRIAAGCLEDWAIPGYLIDMLAQQIASRVHAGECLRTVELYGNQLRAAVCRHHPKLGAKVIQLNRRSDGQAEASDNDASVIAPAETEGRRLSPSRNLSRGLGHAAVREDATDARLIEGVAAGNVTSLYAPTRGGGIGRGAPFRPLRDTVTLAATSDLTAEILVMMTTQVLHHVWWSCQSWIDMTTPRSLKAQIAHAGRVARSAKNQLGVEAELERRHQPIPIAPTPTYIVSIRFDQAYGES